MAVSLLMVSTSLLAEKKTECNINANFHACDNFQARNAVNAVPEPGSLVLIAYSGDSDHLFWFYSITDPSNAMGPIVSL